MTGASPVKNFISICSLISILMTSMPVFGNDWSQWRGQFFNGSSDEQNAPESWGQTEGIAWISPLPGPGGATPVISDGKVFVSSMVGASNDFVALCFDANNGKKLWQKTVGSTSRRLPNNTMASPSPAADGKNVFFLYGSGDLVGFDFEGNKLWSRNIADDYGTLTVSFGYSASPLLFRNKLYIVVIRRDSSTRGGQNTSEPLESFLMALNPQTGTTIWKQPRSSNTFAESMESYTTPIPFINNGRAEILNIGSDIVTANDPNDGKELWRFEYQTTKVRDSRIVPSLVTGGGLIFGARYKHHGVFALKPAGTDNDSQPSIAWEFDNPSPDVSSPLYYQNRLYVLDGIKTRIVTCLEPKSGEKIWQGAIGGRGPWRASLTGVGDKLYCINETGEVVVLAAGGDQFNILFETKIDEGPIRSSIAVADGRLFIRTAENLYCIGK
jgi:outer membrane protein assembly factor BamB